MIEQVEEDGASNEAKSNDVKQSNDTSEQPHNIKVQITEQDLLEVRVLVTSKHHVVNVLESDGRNTRESVEQVGLRHCVIKV